MIPGIKLIAGAMRRKVAFYQAIRRDPRTPALPRILLAVAIAYIAAPVDLIPDFIPVLGQLDDAVVIPVLVLVAIAMVPRDVVADARRSAKYR